MRQLALRAAVNRHWREKRQCLSPAFFFILEKAVKSIGNAVIPTFPMHRSHGLQHLRYKRSTFAFTPESGYTLGFRRKIAHSGSHAETGAFSLRSQRCLVLPAKSSPKEPAGESGCTPMACVRFLRHRDPAGLRKPILLLQRGYFCTATSLANSWNFQSRLLDIPTSIAKPSVFCYNILKSR